VDFGGNYEELDIGSNKELNLNGFKDNLA